MNQDTVIIIQIIIKILVFLINTSFLVAGSIICKNTNELGSASEEFHLAWVCNLVLTCLSGVAAFIDFVTCCGLSKKEEDKNSSLTELFNLGGLGVSIWALVLWFEELNLNNFEKTYYSLFMLMQIRVYFTLVTFGILAVILLGACCVCCISIASDKQQVEESKENNSNTLPYGSDFSNLVNDEEKIEV